MTPAAELLQPDSNPALYVSSVLTLYVYLPDTPCEQGPINGSRVVSTMTTCHYTLWKPRCCLGRYAAAPACEDAPRLSPIRSWVIVHYHELGAHPAPEVIRLLRL